MTTASTTWGRRVFERLAEGLFPAVFFLFWSWNRRPDSWLGTLAFVLLVWCGMSAANWAGHAYMHNAFAERLKARTAHEQPVSPARLAYLVIGLLGFFLVWGLLLFAAHLARPYLPSVLAQYVP